MNDMARKTETERETWRRARRGVDGDGVREILGQKSIHQWQICWWYESIIRRVKDRLSLIISLKIAQMTSIRHGHVDTYVPSVMCLHVDEVARFEVLVLDHGMCWGSLLRLGLLSLS